MANGRTVVWILNVLLLLGILWYVGFQSHYTSGIVYQQVPGWFIDQAPQNATAVLALGDSYVKGEGVSREESWPAQLVERLSARMEDVHLEGIIARTGWTSLQLHQYAMPAYEASDPDITLLQIGANDVVRGVSYERFRSTIRSILMKLESSERVLVVLIPDFSDAPRVVERDINQSLLAKQIENYNTILKEEAGRKDRDVIDITDLGTEKPRYLDDGLHYQEDVYRTWVNHIMEQGGFAQNTTVAKE